MARGNVVVAPTTDIGNTILLQSPRDTDRHYVGEVGAIIMVEVDTTITGARKASLSVKKPDDTVATWEGTVVQDKYIQYVTKLGDLDQAGVYLIQGYAEAPAWSGYTKLVEMKIYNLFDR